MTGLQVRAFAGRQERCGKTVRRAGKACLIAKGSRIPADWARHPWLAHFALQAGLTCPASGGAGFFGIRSGLSAVDESGSARSGRKEQCSVGRQARVGKTVSRAGKACLIAKGSRIPADWARHPWLAHFAFQAGLTCTVGIGAGFCGIRSGLSAVDESGSARAGRKWQ